MHTFYKYQGTGNDFIIFDNRPGDLSLNQKKVARLCHRKFGIGADGLMLLEPSEGYDFRMVYFNPDGNLSSMCGNGGRCIAAFAKRLGIVQKRAHFLAVDGPHIANIINPERIRLSMKDVDEVQFLPNDVTVLDTGSPHYILPVQNLSQIDVSTEGAAIRNSEAYKEHGINVNFTEVLSDGLHLRTYERGVEDETLSCGTGVTAAAIAQTKQELGSFTTQVHSMGGMLSVSFDKTAPNQAKNVWLEGPATFVFSGEI